MRKSNVGVEPGMSIMSNQWQFVSPQATLISLFDTSNIPSANQSLIPFQKITYIIFTRLWSQSLSPKFNIYTDFTLSLQWLKYWCIHLKYGGWALSMTGACWRGSDVWMGSWELMWCALLLCMSYLWALIMEQESWDGKHWNMA